MANQLNPSQFSMKRQEEQSQNRDSEIRQKEQELQIEGRTIRTHTHDGINSKTISSAGQVYTDRGDLASYDLTSPTIDGDWNEWDASTIVGGDCKLAHIKVKMNSSSATNAAVLRPEGTSNEVNRIEFCPNVASTNKYQFAWLAPTNGKFDYNINATFSTCEFAILGYWT